MVDQHTLRLRTTLRWLRTPLARGILFAWHPPSIDANELARGLVTGWMDSPGHRVNLMDEATRRIGVGVAIEESIVHRYTLETVFATQNFSACK